eukprot:20161-Heterococcus_DN1.PRE.2
MSVLFATLLYYHFKSLNNICMPNADSAGNSQTNMASTQFAAVYAYKTCAKLAAVLSQWSASHRALEASAPQTASILHVCFTQRHELNRVKSSGKQAISYIHCSTQEVASL